jgi:hypothetical protein
MGAALAGSVIALAVAVTQFNGPTEAAVKCGPLLVRVVKPADSVWPASESFDCYTAGLTGPS